MQNIVFILFNIPPLMVLIGAFILFFKGKCSRSVRISMSVLLWLLAIAMGLYAQYYNPKIIVSHYWLFSFLFTVVVPFCPPAYYVFLNRLTDKHKTPTLNILALLPAILYAAMLISANLFLTGEERQAFLANEILGQNIQMDSSMAYEWMEVMVKRVFGVFIAAEGILVMIYGEFRLNTYVHLLNEYYTAYSSQKARKVRGVHTLSIIVASLFLFMSVIPLSDAANLLWFLGIIIIIELVMVSLIISYVMKIEYSAEDLYSMLDVENNVDDTSTVRLVNNIAPIHKAGNDRPDLSRAMEPVQQPLIARIDEAMEKDNLFLSADLSIVSLAEKVGTNRTYVSKAIKDAKGCNFSDYVNRYRLDYAVDMMKNMPKASIVVQNIALQCGCGSIQTFYRYFKLFFNETPTQWIERNK